MRAAILYKLNSPLVVSDLEIPALKKGQVLVKIQYSGICRSQLNEIRGFRGDDKYLPHLLGHEGAGIVDSLGSGVTKVKTGDHVVISWIKGKGLEADPAKYKDASGVINAGPVTTFGQYSIIPENRLTKIPKKVPLEVAALIGCAVATGAGVILHVLPTRKNLTVAILGVGGIGSGMILGAAMKNYKQIIAIDINQKSLDLARKLGTTTTLLFSPETISRDIRKFCPQGVDVVIEATGNKIAMEVALELISSHGTVIIAGNLRHEEKISINPFELIKGKKLIGTWGGNTIPDLDFPYYARSYLTGKLRIDKLISKRFRLDEINQAFALLEQRKHVGRMLIDFT